jgi:uncharacterized DUF497 family protein
MEYEWDEEKAKANLAKHKVDFSDATEFNWETAIETYDDRSDYGEGRWIALGFIRDKLYVLVYTLRSDKIRLISLRKATKRERRFYEEKA